MSSFQPPFLTTMQARRTATGFSASIFAPTAPVKSCAPLPSPSLKASIPAIAPNGPRCLEWWNIHAITMPGSTRSFRLAISATLWLNGSPKSGKTQFHLAETEKYPHVTFFLNGGKEDPEPGEDRYMAPSPHVATYDLQPEMSADEVTTHFVSAIGEGYDLIVVNYANPDMVGHTGDLQAAMLACEAVDQGLERVVQALDEVGGAMIITADHGNCETMVDPETGGPHTAHTLNPVPVILVGGPEGASLASGRLSDLAPTLLQLMQLPQPKEMTGKSLIR